MKKIDTYFNIAKAISDLSHDSQTKVGCVLIAPEGEVLLCSFNGFVRGAKDCSLPNTRPQKYIYIQHAEVNALYQAARRGIQVRDCILVTTMSPCSNCLRAVWQAGIDTIYFKEKYKDFDSHICLGDIAVSLKHEGEYTKIKLG